MNKTKKQSGHAQNGLLETLLADLGKNYDPNAALKFLKLLENETKAKEAQLAKKNLKSLLDNPPNEDTSLHIIYQTPYVLGEVVLAGKKTLNNHPLCKYYPIHFKKTYLKALSRWETNPAHEATQSHKIWKHFESESQTSSELKEDKRISSTPLPLGSNANTYRSQLLEAKSLGSLSPVNSNATPEEIIKQILFTKKNKVSFKKLWEGLEDLNLKIKTLHSGGFLHNDLHKENLLIREDKSTTTGCLIDFETSEEDERFQTLEWDQATRADKRHFLKESCLILLCSPQKEEEEILNKSQFKGEILNTMKSDALLLTIQRQLSKQHKIPTNPDKFPDIF